MRHLDAYLPPERGVPMLRINMVSSVDGAATLQGRSGGLGGPADQELMQTLRMIADVIVVGARTVEVEGYQGDLISESAQQWRREHGLSAHPEFVTASRSAGRSLSELLSRYKDAHILCEGGPHLFAVLAAMDAIDEVCLTVGPLLAGPGEGRISQGAPHPVRRLKLIHAIPDGDLLFLRYARTRPPSQP